MRSHKSLIFGTSVATFVLICCSLFLFILSSGCGGQDTDHDGGTSDTGSVDTGVQPDGNLTDTNGDDPCQICRSEGLICPEEVKNSDNNPSALSRQDCIDPNAPGTLKIKANTTAENPSIFIDGSNTGKTAPAKLEKQPGKYKVALKADGYLMYKRKPQQVEVKPEQKTKVTIPLYRDATGRWQDQNDPDRKFDVKMHFGSLRTGEECKDDVYLQDYASSSERSSSHCVHPDDTISLCSKDEPCQGFWWKGKILSKKKYRLTTCTTNNGCSQPQIFKKISE